MVEGTDGRYYLQAGAMCIAGERAMPDSKSAQLSSPRCGKARGGWKTS